MTRRLTTEAVARIYEVQLSGCGRLRDLSLIDGAVNSPYQTFGGVDFYPTLAQKAGKLLDAIQRVQAYTDGNKRLAWLSCDAFLRINGQELVEIDPHDVDDFVRSLCERREAEEYAAAWLKERMRICA